MSARTPISLIALGLTLAVAVPARAQRGPRLDAVDARARAQRIALTGDLGLPRLPPVSARSPLDDMRFADRRPVGQGPAPAAGQGAVLVDAVVPKGEGGTGTDKVEVIQYQLPPDYDPDGTPRPLLVAYHGYGASAKSVAAQSTLDEECAARGWIYLSVTGLDDQLYGSLISQQHTEAAIQWMLDGFAVDPERISMVGFSMGGGVALSFAARHRDPDGIMIAGLGLVSSVSDWTATWTLGTPATKAVLEGPFNFGGPPGQVPFAYQRCSGLVMETDSYPPLPGVVRERVSMATNLAGMPVHVTYDVNDPLPLVEPHNAALLRLFDELGNSVDVAEQFGTVDPDTGFFAPHSWAVLDEARLFEHLQGARAVRHPSVFAAQLDRDTGVSHVQVTQHEADGFSWLAADLDAGGVPTVRDVENVAVLRLDAGAAGHAASRHYASASVDALGHELDVVGLDVTPSWVVVGPTKAFLPGHEPDPSVHGVSVPVAPGRDVALEFIVERSWNSSLQTVPDPVAIQQPVTIELDGPDDAEVALLVLGGTQALHPLPGGELLGVLPTPPAESYLLPLLGGDLSLPFTMPTDTHLFGVELVLQAVLLDGRSDIIGLSNVWVAHVLPQGG